METEQKTNASEAKNDENELKAHLHQAELSDNENKTTQNVPGNDVFSSFKCPDSILDFLQDKPVKVQEFILTKNLSSDQKKKVRDIFKANEHELAINRLALKELIEDLCKKYPELQPYFSNKIIFLSTFGFGFYERKNMVEDILSMTTPETL